VQSAIALAFHGEASVTIPPGALVLSDPVALKLPALSDLAISLFIPAQTISSITQHGAAYQTNYMVEGNHVGDKALDDAKKFASWRFVKGVEVMASATSGAIVTFGDSITDGAHSTVDANSRWPDVLAARLHADKKTSELAVLNQGIGGNRLLHDIAGPSALARFDRDVLAQSGVRYLIVLEGINDIGRTAKPQHPGDPVTAPQMLMALQQIIDRAHAHGIKVYGATLTPYHSAKYASADGETMRAAENAFIRSGKFDGIIEFDKATQDPANPLELLPAEDSGDHLHPNDAGYKAMGESIDLKLFEK
jgi:lysophospholipase L1-like esterase